MTTETVVARSATWCGRDHRPRLSVVVPVYNTAPYVEAALTSLVPSSFADLEIVAVHDGGVDGSREIVARWIAAAPVAAILIDQPNQGLSVSRMTGLRYATGSCIGFVDSDDIADCEVLLLMAEDAMQRGCDVVICRARVLDGNSLEGTAFYDCDIWTALLGNAVFRRVTLRQEPRLMRLEPNANVRVMRREFIDAARITFPAGKVFEDIPAHARQLALAGAIGVRGEVGYLYRVNRPGKITDERGARRFDAIDTVRAALLEARQARVNVEAGSWLVAQGVRMLFWCGQNVTNAQRADYVRRAIAVLADADPRWLAGMVSGRATIDERERIIASLFSHGDHVMLAAMMAGMRPPVWRTLVYMTRPCGRLAVVIVWRKLRLAVLRMLGGVRTRIAA